MKELTRDQYREISEAINHAGYALAKGMSVYAVSGDDMAKAGRAAYEASRPFAYAEDLAEPTADEIQECGVDARGMWTVSDTLAVQRFLRVRLLFLTAQPDPAVEAVAVMPELNGWSEVAKRSAAERIVAAVREADAARGRK